MLTFNTLLEDAGLKPEEVKLARHKDNRYKVTPYSVWRNDPDAFLTYNRIQKPKKFDKANFIASFVVSPADETLFTGIYQIGYVGVVPRGTVCPVSGADKYRSEAVFYELSPTDCLAEYQGLVIID